MIFTRVGSKCSYQRKLETKRFQTANTLYVRVSLSGPTFHVQDHLICAIYPGFLDLGGILKKYGFTPNNNF